METCPCPGFQFLYKYKSVEHPTPRVPRKTKFREVITYARHSYPRVVGKIMGRSLTQFWKLTIKWLVPNEMLKMTDLLDFVRDTVKQQRRVRIK